MGFAVLIPPLWEQNKFKAFQSRPSLGQSSSGPILYSMSTVPQAWRQLWTMTS